MANAFRHKRYFRLSEADGSTLVSFSSTSDANTKIGFAGAWSTSSPTKVETLEICNRNHFDIILDLGNHNEVLGKKVINMIKGENS